MFKEIAWNTFEKTGNVNTFLEMKGIETMEVKNKFDEKETVNINTTADIEKYINNMITNGNLGDIIGNNKDNWYCD